MSVHPSTKAPPRQQIFYQKQRGQPFLTDLSRLPTKHGGPTRNQTRYLAFEALRDLQFTMEPLVTLRGVEPLHMASQANALIR